MVKEVLWDGMDGWDWMVIIGHRYSKSTFGANKEGTQVFDIFYFPAPLSVG